jgi:putative membrane protein
VVVSICLAFSALYELIEWWTAVATGEAAEAFLGTQGDVWDTQWDMMLALIGTILALLVLSRLHDRQLAGRSTGRPAPEYYLAAND